MTLRMWLCSSASAWVCFDGKQRQELLSGDSVKVRPVDRLAVDIPSVICGSRICIVRAMDACFAHHALGNTLQMHALIAVHVLRTG